MAAAVWFLFENDRLVTDHYTVEVSNLPDSFVGKRIVHLSDLHQKKYPDGYGRLIEKCRECEPDYIFFTGDLFSRNQTVPGDKLTLMKGLLSIAPVYYIVGNHEIFYPEKARYMNDRLTEVGVNVLINRRVRLVCNDESVDLYGLALPMEHYKSPSGSYRRLAPVTKQELDSLLGTPDKNRCSILLAHTPLPFREYASWGADLVFAGHVHGGVIRLPAVGGLLSPERKFLPEFTKGVYTDGDSSMIVSAGLGKFRLMNPSQVICAELKKSEK